MGLDKQNYVDGSTVIMAQNLNDIQDAIIDLEETRNVPTNVRSALLTLLESAAYATTGLEDEIAVVQAWAEEVTSLTLSVSTLTLNSDVPSTITAIVVPVGSTVVWTSSDESVATVSDGVVTGTGNGECVITATSGDLTATCDVTVDGFAELESISATYTQSGTVYDTDSLDSLKGDLVVVANYSDSSTAVVPSTDYTLSGTLAAGTSTITVAYGGKTTTFSVTVTHQMNLDDIAYGTLTYRDIFVTGNMVAIGNFEGTYTMDGEFHNIGDSNNQYKMVYSGSPSLSTTYAVSPTHSLKCFGTSPVRSYYKRVNQNYPTGTKFLICANIRCDRYVAGNVGAVFNSPVTGAVEAISAKVMETTSGFVPKASLISTAGTRTEWCVYIGVNGSSSNADAYIDDVVVATVPSTMTDAEAQTLYENYTTMILGGAV